MNEIIINNLNGMLTVSSLQIANDFGKQHKHILDAIENLKAENPALTKMFIETTYTAGTGKHYKRYDITRDGFSLLVMGFTGKKALEWKLKYIEAFNLMEDKLRNNLNGINLEEVIVKSVSLAVSETVKALIPFIMTSTWTHKMSPLEIVLENSDENFEFKAQAGGLWLTHDGETMVWIGTESGSMTSQGDITAKGTISADGMISSKDTISAEDLRFKCKDGYYYTLSDVIQTIQLDIQDLYRRVGGAS